jgi:hypothetical protein
MRKMSSQRDPVGGPSFGIPFIEPWMTKQLLGCCPLCRIPCENPLYKLDEQLLVITCDLLDRVIEANGDMARSFGLT